MEFQENHTKTGVMLYPKEYISKSKTILTGIVFFILSLFFTSALNASTGEEIFKANCAACHKTSAKKLVGPGLMGMNEKHSAEWLVKWVKNSQELIDSGDEDAIAIYNEFNKMPMMAYAQFSDEEITSIFSYIDESNIVVDTPTKGASSTSISQTNTSDSESGNSTFFWLFLIFILVGLYVYRLTKKVRKLSEGVGSFAQPYAVKNYALIFVLYIAVTCGLIYLLTDALADNGNTLNSILFGAFPYVAIAILLIGSIYRYTKHGFKVSSLSTQFLEGKKLFWGSHPFHWGLFILFFGHLTAFLFPRAVLAWNGEPVRLLILEISSFAFAFLALIGLFLLIKRRLSSKSLMMVTNKMDMVVYIVLLTQIISGIGVAYFVRWGSSWFASVLTPYLRSIFEFNPDIAAISEAPIWIQVHVISAFTIIAIIPFSRFMHFLVAPVQYIWRNYQVVIWNWNPKAIRKSTRHFFGHKPKNH